MEKKTYLGKVVTIKMRGGNYIQGIIVDTGLNWVLLKYIPVDYVVDGFVFINTKYISKIDISDDDLFTENILKLKGVDFYTPLKFDLENADQFLKTLKEKSILISIELKNPEKNYVGLITIEREKSMRVHLISKRADLLKEETFLYSELRAIYFENDYLYSLGLLQKRI